MTLTSKLVWCQAIEWTPHSNRPQSTPTYCCQCVASILADIHRWNIDPWTMLHLPNNRVCFRRFATDDSSWHALYVRDSSRPNRPAHLCRSTSICVEHYPRRPDRQPMNGQWIFPMNCVNHPPNRLCTNRRRYRLPIQRWIWSQVKRQTVQRDGQWGIGVDKCKKKQIRLTTIRSVGDSFIAP